jgi:hypothetical protein
MKDPTPSVPGAQRRVVLVSPFDKLRASSLDSGGVGDKPRGSEHSEDPGVSLIQRPILVRGVQRRGGNTFSRKAGLFSFY